MTVASVSIVSCLRRLKAGNPEDYGRQLSILAGLAANPVSEDDPAGEAMLMIDRFRALRRRLKVLEERVQALEAQK